MRDLQTFFSQVNLFFDKVYVITLQRATDRHVHIRQELEGLDYELFYGKDKQEFDIEDLEQRGIYSEALCRRHHRYGKAMSAGAVGCAWSHAEVYKTIIREGYQKVLILEDDAVIDRESIHLWPQLLPELPADWDLVYLGFTLKETVPRWAPLKKAVYHLQRFIGALKFTHTTISNLYPRKIGKYVSIAGYHDCTHAYGISLAGAKQLLALQTPISFVADHLLAYAATNRLVKAYIIQPKLIHQQCQVGAASVSYIQQ